MLLQNSFKALFNTIRELIFNCTGLDAKGTWSHLHMCGRQHASKIVWFAFPIVPVSLIFYTLHNTFPCFPQQIVCSAIFNLLISFLCSYSYFQFFMQLFAAKHAYTLLKPWCVQYFASVSFICIVYTTTNTWDVTTFSQFFLNLCLKLLPVILLNNKKSKLFCEKGFLKNFAKFGKQVYQSFILIKFQARDLNLH